LYQNRLTAHNVRNTSSAVRTKPSEMTAYKK